MALVKCYLIGGAPLSGKTTLASAYAAKYQAVQISTDNIRDWMQKLTRPKDYPELFYSHNMSVEEFYKKYDTAQKVMEGEVNQANDVAKGITALLECYLPWEQLVIEGIGITPALVPRLIKKFPNIVFEPTFIYDNNTPRIDERIHTRGLWDKASTYPEHIKQKELEWVILYNEWYEQEAKKYGFALRTP